METPIIVACANANKDAIEFLLSRLLPFSLAEQDLVRLYTLHLRNYLICILQKNGNNALMLAISNNVCDEQIDDIYEKMDPKDYNLRNKVPLYKIIVV